VVQLERVRLRSSAFGFPKVAQTDADKPIALARVQVHSFAQLQGDVHHLLAPGERRGWGVTAGKSLELRRLRWLHIASLVWRILTELVPWSCPLTVLENWLEAKAGVQPYHGGFLLHYLDKLVYPDISSTMLTIAG
jgi:hypothetical protein